MSTDPIETQPSPPDDSYPGEWRLPPAQAAAVREIRTQDLAAHLGRLTHAELLEVLNDALDRKS